MAKTKKTANPHASHATVEQQMRWALQTIALAIQTAAFRRHGRVNPLNIKRASKVVATLLVRQGGDRPGSDPFTPEDQATFFASVFRFAAEELDIALPVGE